MIFDDGHCCDCGSSSSGAACCPSDVTCSCDHTLPECACECIDEFTPVTRPRMPTDIISLSAKNASLYSLAVYFNKLFPGQIAIPVSFIHTRIGFDFRYITISETIDRLGLIRLRNQLIPYTYYYNR